MASQSSVVAEPGVAEGVHPPSTARSARAHRALRPPATLRLGAVIAACLAVFVWLAGPADAQNAPPAAEAEVDVVLVLSVDISFSMDPDEQRLQREGYVAAFRSAEVQAAIARGLLGRIAVAYVEWAGAFDQRVLVPFTVVDGGASAEGFAAALEKSPLRRAARTSVSGAIDFSAALIGGSGFRAARRVIDVSGDGPNNQGRVVTEARDAAIAAGIVVNGLPLLLKRPNSSMADIDNLDDYYEDCVIGGPGSFMIPVRETREFVDAARRKLVLEISGLEPRRRADAASAILRVQAGGAPERRDADCLVGERMWRERWERN